MSGLALRLPRPRRADQRQRSRRVDLHAAPARGRDRAVDRPRRRAGPGRRRRRRSRPRSPTDNVELLRAREREQRVLHRAELLAELTAAGRLIAVAGAHGKTTTSGMIAHALRETGVEPAFMLGGELPGAGPAGSPANAGWGAGGVIVAEADESDGSFLRLDAGGGADHQRRARPPLALVGGGRAVGGVRGLLRRAARLVVAAAGAAARAARLAETSFAIAARSSPTLEAEFGADSSARRRPVAASSSCDCPGGPVAVRLGVPGRHNVANATAALAALHAAGAGETLPPLAELAAALAVIPGHGAAPGAQGGEGRGLDLRRLRPPPDRGRGEPRGAARAAARAPDRRLPAASVLAYQGAGAALRPRPGRAPTWSGCSTSTRPASGPSGRAAGRQRPRRGSRGGLRGPRPEGALAAAGSRRRSGSSGRSCRAAICSSRSEPAMSSSSPTGSSPTPPPEPARSSAAGLRGGR